MFELSNWIQKMVQINMFQVIVQRLLAAKNISSAKAGTVMAGFLKLLPFFTLVLPGMAARILFTNEVLSFFYWITSK